MRIRGGDGSETARKEWGLSRQDVKCDERLTRGGLCDREGGWWMAVRLVRTIVPRKGDEFGRGRGYGRLVKVWIELTVQIISRQ
jgi:hypothetical protein